MMPEKRENDVHSDASERASIELEFSSFRKTLVSEPFVFFQVGTLMEQDVHNRLGREGNAQPLVCLSLTTPWFTVALAKGESSFLKVMPHSIIDSCTYSSEISSVLTPR